MMRKGKRRATSMPRAVLRCDLSLRGRLYLAGIALHYDDVEQLVLQTMLEPRGRFGEGDAGREVRGSRGRHVAQPAQRLAPNARRDSQHAVEQRDVVIVVGHLVGKIPQPLER